MNVVSVQRACCTRTSAVSRWCPGSQEPGGPPANRSRVGCSPASTPASPDSGLSLGSAKMPSGAISLGLSPRAQTVGSAVGPWGQPQSSRLALS